MNGVKQEMIIIYELDNYDWMNFLIEGDDITYHHIKKVEDGGLRTVDNGALLTSKAHSYLHKIENMDIEIYNELNTMFTQINEQHHKPTNIQRKKIQLLLMKFEITNVDKLIKKKERIDVKIRKKVAINRRKEMQKYEWR